MINGSKQIVTIQEAGVGQDEACGSSGCRKTRNKEKAIEIFRKRKAAQKN